MTQPRIAVLGLGSIGQRHAANLVALGCSVCGYDPSPEARSALRSIGARPALTRDEALEGAAAVVVASPNAAHLDDLRAAIDAGTHVFVEKPLAHTDRSVDVLVERAEAAGRVVFAGMNLRFHPAVREGKAALSGLGRPLWARLISASYLPDWRPGQDHRTNYAADPRTGGVLFDLIHEFDLANNLLGPGRTVAAVARCTGTLGIGSEDCADIILSHENGALSTLHLDYVTRPRLRVTEVGCEGGLLRIDIRNRSLQAWDAKNAVVADTSFGGAVDDDYRTEMASFLACLRGEEQPACDGRQALSVLRQVLAARRMCGLEEAA